MGRLGDMFRSASSDAFEMRFRPNPVPVRGVTEAVPQLSGENLGRLAETLSSLPIPVVSDALSGVLAARDVAKGDYGSATMNAVGLLPFVPSVGGMIKETGNLAKNAIYPSEHAQSVVKGLNKLPKSNTWDSAGNVYEDMSAMVKPLTSGDYMVTANVPWGRKNKPFYAIGDDPEELASYAMDRLKRGDKAIQAAQRSKEENSLLGMLTNEYGDSFKTARSNRSDSEYITHVPSGLKIRISDHNLPLGYEQPDLDLRSSMSKEDMLKAIKSLLGQ